MIFTKVWSADPKIAEAFSKRFGTEIVKSFDSMVGKVHAMFVDDVESFRADIKNGFERRLLELMR